MMPHRVSNNLTPNPHHQQHPSTHHAMRMQPDPAASQAMHQAHIQHQQTSANSASSTTSSASPDGLHKPSLPSISNLLGIADGDRDAQSNDRSRMYSDSFVVMMLCLHLLRQPFGSLKDTTSSEAGPRIIRPQSDASRASKDSRNIVRPCFTSRLCDRPDPQPFHGTLKSCITSWPCETPRLRLQQHRCHSATRVLSSRKATRSAAPAYVQHPTLHRRSPLYELAEHSVDRLLLLARIRLPDEHVPAPSSALQSAPDRTPLQLPTTSHPRLHATPRRHPQRQPLGAPPLPRPTPSQLPQRAGPLHLPDVQKGLFAPQQPQDPQSQPHGREALQVPARRVRKGV